MLTALVLQLIQCVVILPDNLSNPLDKTKSDSVKVVSTDFTVMQFIDNTSVFVIYFVWLSQKITQFVYCDFN